MPPKRTNTSLVSTLATHTARDPARLLGDVVWWQLGGGEIDTRTLTDIWNDAGLPPEFLPEPPSAERAFRAAIRSSQVGLSDRLLRIAQDDEQRLLVGIVAESREHADLHYAVEARVSLDHASDRLHTDDAAHPLVQRIQERFHVCHTTHALDDVRRALVRTLESINSIQLRSSGGVLFAPAPGSVMVRRLQSAIARIGESRLFVLPISESQESQATLSHVARQSLEEDLNRLREEIESFVAAPPERDSTLTRRLDQFEELRSRARLFSTLLQVQVGDLDSQIGSLEGVVHQMVTARNAA